MTRNGRNAHKTYYKSNHDPFGNPTFTPDGYQIPDEPDEPDTETEEPNGTEETP